MLCVVWLSPATRDWIAARHPAFAEFLYMHVYPLMPSWPQYFAVQTLAALIAVCGTLYWVGKEGGLQWPRLNRRHVFPALVTGYAIWAALTYLWSAWPYGTRGYVIRELPFYFLCVAAMLLCGQERRWLTYAKVFAGAAFVEAALQGAILLRLSHTDGKTLGRTFQDAAIFYSNRNAACAVVLTASFIVIGFAINSIVEMRRGEKGRDSKRVMFWAALPFVLAAFGFIFVVAGSLAGYVAAGLGLFAYALCVLPLRRRWLAVLAVSGLAVAVIIAIVASDTLWTKALRFVLSGERTMSVRIVDWMACKELYVRRPLQGWGMGTFPATYARFQPPLARRLPFTKDLRGTHPHNEFARIAADQGLVGLALYVSMLIYAFTASYVALRDRPLKTRLVGYALWAGGLTFVVHCTFGKEPMMWSFAANYWMLLGVLASGSHWLLGGDRGQQEKAPLKIGPEGWAVLAVVLAAVAWAWWTWGVGAYGSTVALNRSRTAQLQMHRPEVAQPMFQEFRRNLEQARARCLWTDEILHADYAAGWFETRHNEWTKGALQLQKVLDTAPDFLDGRLLLAECYAHLERRTEALEQVEQFLSQNPYLVDDGPRAGSSPGQVDEYLARDARKVTAYDVLASVSGLDAATLALEEHVLSRLALPKDWVVEDYATTKEVRKLLDFYVQGGQWEKAHALVGQVEEFFRTAGLKRTYDVRRQVQFLARTYALTDRKALAQQVEAAFPEVFARASAPRQ
jgi:O-antigen ligase/tetratricopeptide (TPR) repeat protein